MGKTIGIDFGTTHSKVAVPGELSKTGFQVIPGCECSVVLDQNKSVTVPSVVAEDRKGNIVVGAQNETISLAKRYMGEEKIYRLPKHGELRPEQVADLVLRYLKEMQRQG